MFSRILGKDQDKEIPAPAPAHLRRWDSTSTTASCTMSTDLKSTSSESHTTSEEYATELPKEIEPWAALLFKYGFFFPLFWVFGALILRSPVELGQPEIDLETGKPKQWTKAQVELFQRTKECERKWARRCLWALITFGVVCLLGLVIGLSVGLTVGRK
ncbi:hypothetical protein V5O48_011019 [Marasmius crinis-equi]|uniref:Transmembrane protein n=1 Tax=Marasmius crinis-equi TaxID=585013 RepID=A0ABR3F6R2_9AGAR